MRTTLTIDDDVLKAAQSLALTRGTTIGSVVSELVRIGLHASRSIAEHDGIPTFVVSEKTPAFTADDVAAIEDEA